MKSIEQWIKQETPFKSEKEKLLVNLIYTDHHITSKIDSFFKSFDLTQKQYNVLRILRGARNGVSTSYIRKRLLVKNADVSRLTDRLLDKNLVNKNTDRDDKRLISISLTDSGKDLLKSIDGQLQKFIKKVIPLDSWDCKELNLLLDKLKSN